MFGFQITSNCFFLFDFLGTRRTKYEVMNIKTYWKYPINCLYQTKFPNILFHSIHGLVTFCTIKPKYSPQIFFHSIWTLTPTNGLTKAIKKLHPIVFAFWFSGETNKFIQAKLILHFRHPQPHQSHNSIHSAVTQHNRLRPIWATAEVEQEKERGSDWVAHAVCLGRLCFPSFFLARGHRIE